MALTQQQLQLLSDTIEADPTLDVQPDTSDGAAAIAADLNKVASPNFTVWKTNATIREIGDKIDGTELAGLSSLNNTRLQTAVMLSQEGVNPSLPDRREFFDDIFSGAGGVITRANLLVLWKRLANRFEKIYATGTGSDASPALLVIEGKVTYEEVLQARSLP